MMSNIVEKSLDTILGNAKLDMEEAMGNLLSAVISATNTMDEFWEECQRLTADLKEAVDGAAETIGETPRSQVNKRRENSPEPTGGGTYADQRKTTPLMHATVIERGEMQKQRVQLVKVAGMEGDGMAELTEKQLVEKANVALDIMGLQAEDKLEGTRFVGVSKLNGAGRVMYEMNLEEVAKWLKGGNVVHREDGINGGLQSTDIQSGGGLGTDNIQHESNGGTGIS